MRGRGNANRIFSQPSTCFNISGFVTWKTILCFFYKIVRSGEKVGLILNRVTFFYVMQPNNLLCLIFMSLILILLLILI